MTDTLNKNNKNNEKIPHPCIRNCCLDKNDICMGCHRSVSEIMGWNNSTESQKREVMAKCRLREKQRFSRFN